MNNMNNINNMNDTDDTNNMNNTNKLFKITKEGLLINTTNRSYKELQKEVDMKTKKAIDEYKDENIKGSVDYARIHQDAINGMVLIYTSTAILSIYSAITLIMGQLTNNLSLSKILLVLSILIIFRIILELAFETVIIYKNEDRYNAIRKIREKYNTKKTGLKAISFLSKKLSEEYAFKYFCDNFVDGDITLNELTEIVFSSQDEESEEGT